MKNLLKVFAAIAMVAIGFVACEQAESNSIKVSGGDVYTTVPYTDNNSKKTVTISLANELKADATIAVKVVKDGDNADDAFAETSPTGTALTVTSNIAENKKSVSFDLTEVPATVLGDKTKGVVIVKIAKDQFAKALKDDVILKTKSIIKARSATATGNSISWNKTYEESAIPTQEVTIKLTGCKFSVKKDDFEANKIVTSAVVVKVVGENDAVAENKLPTGIKVELVAKDKDDPADAAANCIKSTDEFKVKISGNTIIGEQAKGKLVFTLPAACIDGADLKFESSIEFEVKAPAQQGS